MEGRVGWKNKQKATPDAVSIRQPKTIFEFGLPSIIAYSQRNITVPRPVRSDGQKKETNLEETYDRNELKEEL